MSGSAFMHQETVFICLVCSVPAVSESCSLKWKGKPRAKMLLSFKVTSIAPSSGAPFGPPKRKLDEIHGLTETDASTQYFSRAIKKFKKQHLDVTVGEILWRCSSLMIGVKDVMSNC